MSLRIFSCILVLLVFLLASCGAEAEQPAQNSITYGLTLIPSGFDPHIYQSTELGIVLRQVYDTLVYRNPDTGEFEAGLAAEWSVSEDGLVYEFRLRQGVTFHDGTAFNADAVAVNLDRILNPETASQKAVFMLGPYLSYQIVDSYTIRMILAEPYVPLLDALSQVYLGIASPTALAEYTPNTYQFHQVGTGPFRLVEYLPSDRLVLRRNEDYAWGPSFYQPPTQDGVLVDEIVYRFFTDEATRALALQSGEAQIMGELLPSDARALATNSQIQLLTTEIPGMPLQFLMNTQRPPTDVLAVRQALIYATNRNAIVDAVYQGFSPAAWGPLSASNPFYTRNVVGVYDYNPETARTLLTQLGYSDSNEDGILEANGNDLEIDLIVPNWGLLPEVSLLIQDQWEEVGVRAVIQPVPGFSALRDAVSTGEYNMVSFDTPGIDPAFLNDYFVTGAVRNWMNYSNSELDNLLTLAVREASTATRRGYYAEIQRIIMNEALILPIRDYVNLNGANAGIQGLRFDSYGWFPLMNNVTYIRTG
jgi:peptide/nickel transport system substrate-binding protein